MTAFVLGGLQLGQEWLVDASGCDVQALRDVRVLAGLFEELVVALQLSVVGTPQWHTFPAPGGVTGLALLSESHLAIHTFPEHAYAALSVYSCRTRADDAGLSQRVARALKARDIVVRAHPRQVAR